MKKIPHSFIFIGRSGCGKGTQVKLLLDYLQKNDTDNTVFRLEIGKVFRKFIEKNTYTTNRSKEIYLAGGLQPEFLSIWVWAESFIHDLKDSEHIILDGSPRKLMEAHIMHSAFEFYDRAMPFVFYINTSKEWSTEKLLARAKIEGRVDDNPKDIEKRMAWFEKDVMQAIEFYKNDRRYNFFEIPGENNPEEVFKDVLKSIRSVDAGF